MTLLVERQQQQQQPPPPAAVVAADTTLYLPTSAATLKVEPSATVGSGFSYHTYHQQGRGLSAESQPSVAPPSVTVVARPLSTYTQVLPDAHR